MSMDINKVLLIGNVGQEPKFFKTQIGKEIARFSVATSETWKDKSSGERQKKTNWHNVVVFAEPLVNLTRGYIVQGTRVYIEGTLQTRKFTNNEGDEQWVTEVVINPFNGKIAIQDRGKDERKSDNSGGDYDGAHRYDPPASSDTDAQDLDDEIPF